MQGVRASREVRRQFWELIRSGMDRKRASVALGLNAYTGKDWFKQAGGVVPTYLFKPSTGRRLSSLEREEIFMGVDRGVSIRQIAKVMGRAPSTVSRELHRNQVVDQRRGIRQMGERTSYRPSLAQHRAETKAYRPKQTKLAQNAALRAQVESKLKDRLSPRQIAVELRKEFPDQPEMWVSHETIYQGIYVQGRGSLRLELGKCLRTGRALRRPQGKGVGWPNRIPGMVSISERPAEVEDRAIPGHWEGDLIMGKANKSAIGTLVERNTRYVMLLHLPNGFSAHEVELAMIAVVKRLPKQIWTSLTWDQGMEMRNHAQISIATGLQVYFCDPGKPWQRGSNENTNGLLRQYFPKGTDLSVHSAEHLDFVSTQMNRRPRETLGWRRPAQVLGELLYGGSPAAGVASND